MKFGTRVDVLDVVTWAELDLENLVGVNFTGGLKFGLLQNNNNDNDNDNDVVCCCCLSELLRKRISCSVVYLQVKVTVTNILVDVLQSCEAFMTDSAC